MKADNPGRQIVSQNEQQQLPASPAGDSLTPAQLALHRNYLDSVKTMKTALVRAAYYLEKIAALKIYRLLGFKKIAAYAAIHGGFISDQTERFLHLARRLPAYPQVAEALDTTDLSWGKERVIVTQTDPADQAKWLEVAHSVSTSALSNAVAQARPEPSSLPRSDPVAAPVERIRLELAAPEGMRGSRAGCAPVKHARSASHFVTLKFNSEDIARWHGALEVAMQRSKARCKEEAVLAGLAVLATGTKEGAAGVPPALLTIIECPTCGVGTIPTGRGEAPASTALLKAARCDAVIEDAEANRRQVIPPRVRRLALKRARYACQNTSCGRTMWLEVHHRQPVAGAGGNNQDNLVVLCSSCHRALHAADDAARDAARDAAKV